MQKRFAALFFLASVFSVTVQAQKKYTAWVDPFIGTGGHGHTYPGAVLPHGMVQLSPDTRLDGWDGCGGYHYSDNYIYGFSHTHLSGTGCSDYGDILLAPMTGEPSPDNKKYGSTFSHTKEKASPGFYSVQLDNGVDVKLTSTLRVGLHHYRFNKGAASIILDLKHRDEVLESSLQVIDDRTITGLRRSKAWAENQYVYFVIRFSKPFSSYGTWSDDQPVFNKKELSGKNLKAWFQFGKIDKPEVMAKVAISGVSVEGAIRNLEAELPGWDFEAVRKAATTAWEKELSRVDVSSTDTKQLRTFYTALYHTMVVPNINMDVDNQYRGRDNQIHTASGFTNYSVFSLWDTYRGAHPLYAIIDRKRTLDYIKTFLVQYQQGGRLPVWELSGYETDCMIGYHSVSVITDAYIKGINGFDTRLALEAMKKSATWNHLGLPALMDHGFIEMDDEHESVSKTLEYAYDDWCIAQFAKKLGSENDYRYYIQRAQSYKNMLDVKTGFMRPRKNGNWLSPFEPREVNNNFTEANSWQYSFYMPQDVSGYMNMIGGPKKMEEKLDELFSASQQTTGRDQSDITGLIGQYAHGNEPSHHVAYLYSFAGMPSKTQAMVHRIRNEMYHDMPDGLSGNEDCGQMSAWYVLSSLGFYPVTPGTPDYIIGTPAFSSATIRLENGKLFQIKANGLKPSSYYIQSASLNGKPYNKAFLSYPDMYKGGELVFNMSDKASDFGKTAIPVTAINDNLIVVNPVIDGGARAFKNSTTVSISASQPGLTFYYTLDGSTPGIRSKKYTGPFVLEATTIVKAIAIDENRHPAGASLITTGTFTKAPHDWTIRLNTVFEPQYDGGGATGLIDGVEGSANWRKGNWQGYQKTDVDAVIDLQEVKTVSAVTAGFLQDTRAWIVVPRQLVVEVSTDGKQFTEVYTGNNFLPIDDLNVQVKRIEASFKPVTARYVRIKAVQYGKLPAWHEGAGGDTHIFVDELSVK